MWLNYLPEAMQVESVSVNSSSDEILIPLLFSTALNIATNIKKNISVVLFVKQILIKIKNFL